MHPADFFSEAKRPEGEADQSPYLVPRIRMKGAIFPLPHTLPWRAQKLKCLYLPGSMSHFPDQIKPYDTAGKHKNGAYKDAY